MVRNLFIGILFFLGLAACAVTITISPKVVVDTDMMLLGKIAVITDAGDAQANLEKVELGNAPIPGQSRTLTPEMIRVRLRQFGFKPEAITLDSPPTIQITRLTNDVKGDMMVEIAQDWLMQRLAPSPTEKIELEPMRVPADVQVPLGQVSWNCTPAGLDMGTLRHVSLTLLVNNRPAWTGVLSFKMRRYAEVLVARMAIPRGETLTEQSVARVLSEISTTIGTPMNDIADLVGKRTLNSLPQGAVLTSSNVEQIPLVKRDQVVHVRAQCGAFVINAVAIAMEDGIPGAIIRVRNPDTRLDYSARVVGIGQLELIQ